MAEINELIIAKLASYPSEVRDIATKAIELSETYPETTVAERIEAEIRKLITGDRKI